ncbi:DNA topoisomerase I [Candidatus Woesearchaeota archaeon]|nr:DNA topoisomerase I [Candidatus Woesearchaeota archaeon]
MYELIISEKPKAAQKIAEALANGKAIKKVYQGVPYYEITRGNKDIVVAAAVGHLYGLAQKGKSTWTYPQFDVEWKLTADMSKDARYAKKYYTLLKKLAKDAREFTIACDYDVEGEVIGLNILRFICKQKDAHRMKFSTLTKPDIVEAYDHKSPTLNWGQANAGETRHELDWYYGINVTRALSAAIRQSGRFKVLSSGRVQGPALKIIVDREKEIKAFIPVPYWQIELHGRVNNGMLQAWHKQDKFWNKEDATRIFTKIKDCKQGMVVQIERSQMQQPPPVPFDLTTLQTEAFRHLHIKPKDTLEIAQELYTSGYISYPRTSSQQLPPTIGYKHLLTNVGKQDKYKAYCEKLLQKKTLQPNNGKKTDPAHPAIYPTGIVGEMEGNEVRVYDLIVRRFLATFGDPALRETNTITLEVRAEPFVAKGTRTVVKGWHELYGPYAKFKEEELPPVQEKDQVSVEEIFLHDKETQPPKRYTQASLIKELEARGLGTKSTRASIIDTLFQRGYVYEDPIHATDLGMATVTMMGQYTPMMVDEELTRHFEGEMEEIREGKKKPVTVLAEAKEVLTKTLKEFKEKEKKIGQGLITAEQETRKAMNELGPCPVCGKGQLTMKSGKYGKFIACTAYPACTATFKLPQFGLIKPSKQACVQCQYPEITIIRKGKQPQNICINPECPSKKITDVHAKKEMEAIANGSTKPCPLCKDGSVVLRRGIYGSFYGCSRYPKCKFTENIGAKNEPSISSEKELTVSSPPVAEDKIAEDKKPVTKNPKRQKKPKGVRKR